MKRISQFLMPVTLIFFLLAGCSSGNGLIEKEREEQSGGEISYLALGDSYTIGESVPEEDRWPVQLVQRLRQEGYDLAYPEIIAQTGWTTGDLLDAMDQRLGEEKYDLISISIGVNNQYQGRSIEEYEKELNEIFRRAIQRSVRGANGVFVVSIPDYGATPFGADNAEEIGREIAQFNAVLKRVSKEFGIPFYNITPISQLGKDRPELVAEDGLHPSGKMYKLWVDEIYEEVLELLSTYSKL
ncbi:MAG TPA: SGNH/GDSL hydrolase family protein [Salinimicrobium sp.]|nr:SGNH/GDSL hydrolase family protein [Salinimicrobium sp.]